MAQISLQATEKSPVQAEPAKTSHLCFIDHLRAGMVILVVLHHLAVVYGEGMSFWYVDPPKTASLSGLVSVVFVLFNQAWFMGANIFLGHHFSHVQSI